MFKFAPLSLLLIGSVFAADPIPPAPPACLSGPVTLGSVTLTCTAIDNTSSGFDQGVGGGLLFQVKAASTDPDAISMRFAVVTATLLESGPPVLTTRSGLANKIADGVFAFTFQLFSPPATITSIQVQPLKATGALTF